MNMKNLTKLLLFALINLSVVFVYSSELSNTDQYYIKQLLSKRDTVVRNTAKTLYTTYEVNQEVYDIMAEILANKYQKPAKSKYWLDAYAWMARSLGNTDNIRYFNLLEKVKNEAFERKLRAHAKKAHRQLKRVKKKSSAAIESFEPGIINLEKYQKATEKKETLAPPITNTKRKYSPISEIVIGMSFNDVITLAGPATDSASHVTGQVFNPLNFSGKGVIKVHHYYEGQGYIVYENNSAYSGGRTVVDVILDE